ncbi:MAG: flippase [Bacteroidia bacterium]|nr:flippase [Bacteroidia bacterium]
MITKELIKNNKREVKDVFYLIALQGLNYVAPLIVYPYLMVTLGAEKFGYIGFSMSICTYLMLIVDFGFNLSATKRVALYKDNKSKLNEIFSATIYAKILLLIISFLILVLFAFIPQFKVYVTTMFIVFLMVVGNTFLFIFLFQGLGEIRWVSIFNAVAKLSILPLTFFVVKSSEDYLWAAFLQGGVSVFAAVISLFMLAKKRWVSLLPIDVKAVKIEMKESWPLFLSSAATSVYTASFVVILGFFATPAEVGQYSAVDRIMRAMCYLVLIPILQAFYPYVSRLSKEDKQQAKKTARKLLFLVLGCMVPLAAVLFFASPFAVRFLGDDYLGTGVLFRTMAFVPIFVGLSGVFGQLYLLALGDEKDKRWFQQIYFIAAAVALLSVLLLTPYYFAQGAAWSLLLTEAVVAGLMWSRISRLGK